MRSLRCDNYAEKKQTEIINVDYKNWYFIVKERCKQSRAVLWDLKYKSQSLSSKSEDKHL